jgi:hypothetical protein
MQTAEAINVTAHALARYRERVDCTATDQDVQAAVRSARRPEGKVKRALLACGCVPRGEAYHLAHKTCGVGGAVFVVRLGVVLTVLSLEEIRERAAAKGVKS